ncbi:HEAT repeat domain-containing protein, partial [Elusimicrobiota bacterium]
MNNTIKFIFLLIIIIIFLFYVRSYARNSVKHDNGFEQYGVFLNNTEEDLLRRVLSADTMDEWNRVWDSIRDIKSPDIIDCLFAITKIVGEEPPPVSAQFDSNDWQIYHDTIADMIISFGQDAIPYLERILEHGDLAMRIQVVNVLRLMDAANSVSMLVDILLSDENNMLKIAVSDALTDLGVGAAPSLIELLVSANDDLVPLIHCICTK